MATQTATFSNLEAISNIVIAKCRYTAESATPCQNLIEHFRLGQGNKQITIPKAAAIVMDDLVDGVDIVDSKDLSIATVDLTPLEVGGKFILTDKLVRQFNEDVFAMVGRLGGEAMARKKDKDIIALFEYLNGAVDLGTSGNPLHRVQAMGCVSHALAHLFPQPISVVHHPIAVTALSTSMMAVASSYYAGILGDLSEALLRRFWGLQVNGINFFWDSNIPIAGTSDGIGAIFSKSAMAIVESLSPRTERQRDASLRAWELVFVSDYGVFEIDDGYGAPMIYDISAAATTT